MVPEQNFGKIEETIIALEKMCCCSLMHHVTNHLFAMNALFILMSLFIAHYSLSWVLFIASTVHRDDIVFGDRAIHSEKIIILSVIA